jgi:hypothetical protein
MKRKASSRGISRVRRAAVATALTTMVVTAGAAAPAHAEPAGLCGGLIQGSYAYYRNCTGHLIFVAADARLSPDTCLSIGPQQQVAWWNSIGFWGFYNC